MNWSPAVATLYWQKQTDEPLFPDLIWSRPENKAQAGRLLIIGGSQFGFNKVAQLYQLALQAGIGEARVALPQSLKHVVGEGVPDARFVSGTIASGLQMKALPELTEFSEWASLVVLAGELGKNPTTVELLNHLIPTVQRPVLLVNDTIDLLMNDVKTHSLHSNMGYIMQMAQLQKWGRQLNVAKPLTSTMNLVQLVDQLHDLTEAYQCNFIVWHNESLLVASGGQVSTTKCPEAELNRMAAVTAVFWAQNPTKFFEAATTAAYTVTHE